MIDEAQLLAAHGEAAAWIRTGMAQGPEAWVERLRPTEADYEAVFGPNAEAARQGYTALWSAPESPMGYPGQTSLEVYVATPIILATSNALSRHFPSSYQRIARGLSPDSVWATWRLTVPGREDGMRYDGLVQREGGRWCWFPKPWRVLR